MWRWRGGDDTWNDASSARCASVVVTWGRRRVGHSVADIMSHEHHDGNIYRRHQCTRTMRERERENCHAVCKPTDSPTTTRIAYSENR